MMGARILVAEDDVKQAALVRLYLERVGHAVHVVKDGRSAIQQARSLRPHLVVLDVMLPEVDGLDVCRALRVESDVAILLLTARSSEADLLLGLDLGADDYLTKPYSPRELTARVRALLRRVGLGPGPEKQESVTIGHLHVDAARFQVHVYGEQVCLTAKEFAILWVLAQDPERVFTRPEIIERAFGFDQDVLARTVDAHVMNLRRKLASGRRGERAAPSAIPETVYGRGYRLGVAAQSGNP